MMDAHRSFAHLIGLRLNEARLSLQEDKLCASWAVEIIETAPPQAPQRSARATPRKTKNEPADRPARPEKQFGEWRVLRCVVQESGVQHEQSVLHLVVAREELRSSSTQNALTDNVESENTQSQSVPAAEIASFEAWPLVRRD